MKKILEVKDLCFRYHNNQVFDNLSFVINEGDFVSIVGANGSGKTTLTKLMLGLLPSNRAIFYNNKDINEDIFEVRKNISLILSNPNIMFIKEKVIDDMAFTLENIGMKQEEIRKRLDETYQLLEIEHLLDKNIDELSGGEKQLVALAITLVLKPKIIILDEAFTMLDQDAKTKLFKILKSLNKNGMTIILITHDLNEAILTNRMICLKDGKVVEDDKPLKVIEDELLMEELSLELPFMIDLSLKLKLYEMIDKIIIKPTDMVVKLWP